MQAYHRGAPATQQKVSLLCSQAPETPGSSSPAAASGTTEQKSHLQQITLSRPPARKTLLFFPTSSFSSSCPDPTELPNRPRERATQKTRGSKAVVSDTPQLHLCGVPAASARAVLCAPGLHKHGSFFPLNHLGVRLRSSWPSPINAANRTR